MGASGLALTLGAALAAAVAVAAPCSAAPDTEPTPSPAPAPAGLLPALADVGNALAQDGSEPAGPFGLPDLSAYGPSLLLAQNREPAPPGVPGPAAVPDLNAFNPDYLLPQTLTPAEPGEGTRAPGLGPSSDSPGTGRLSFLGRLYEMYQDGYLRGALLGQTPADEFGDPGVN